MSRVQDASCFLIRYYNKSNAAESDVAGRDREADFQRPPLLERNVSCPMYSFLDPFFRSRGDKLDRSGHANPIRNLIAANLIGASLVSALQASSSDFWGAVHRGSHPRHQRIPTLRAHRHGQSGLHRHSPDT